MSQPAATEPMTIQQVAAYLHVSIYTVHRLVKSGQLKAHKKTLGRTSAYLVDPASVAAFDLQRHEQTGTRGG